jgi:hypothetical protein
MQEFCYAVVDGDEPRDSGPGRFYRNGAVPADGIPELPAEWASFLRENLVIGKIVEVLEGDRVKIDLGSSDCIQKGSVLAVQGHHRSNPRQVQVVSVQEHSCEASEPLRGESEPPLEVGRCVVMRR